jgi:hypothetical protein
MSNNNEKTLIVAQGLERERILAAVNLHSPTKLIILRNTEDLETIKADVKVTIEKVMVDLSTKSRDGLPLFPLLNTNGKVNIESEHHSCNFFDLCQSLEKTSSLIQSELNRGAHVVVDISSGVKIISIAMYLAATLNGVRASYVIAGKYGVQGKEQAEKRQLPEQYAFSVQGSRLLPILPVNFKPIPHTRLQKISNLKGKYFESISEIADSKERKDLMQAHRELRALQSLRLVETFGRGYKLSTDGLDVAKLHNAISAAWQS